MTAKIRKNLVVLVIALVSLTACGNGSDLASMGTGIGDAIDSTFSVLCDIEGLDGTQPAECSQWGQ